MSGPQGKNHVSAGAMLALIRAHAAEHNTPITLKALSEQIGLGLPSVTTQVRKLEGMLYVKVNATGEVIIQDTATQGMTSRQMTEEERQRYAKPATYPPQVEPAKVEPPAEPQRDTREAEELPADTATVEITPDETPPAKRTSRRQSLVRADKPDPETLLAWVHEIQARNGDVYRELSQRLPTVPVGTLSSWIHSARIRTGQPLPGAAAAGEAMKRTWRRYRAQQSTSEEASPMETAPTLVTHKPPVLLLYSHNSPEAEVVEVPAEEDPPAPGEDWVRLLVVDRKRRAEAWRCTQRFQLDGRECRILVPMRQEVA